jgi:lipopolysaccharide export system permease protein
MPSLDISGSGLWLRELSPSGDRILHATRIVDEKKLLLEQTNYLIYDAGGNLSKRVRAQKATLVSGEWVFENAEVHELSGDITKHKRLQLDTASEITDLQEHFRHPNTLSVWSLPQYISAASDTGIDTNSHRVRLYTMLTLPFMLMGMVLVAASFSLPTGRLLSSGRTIGYAILFGFLLFIFGKFVAKLSELSILPILLASLAPPLIATLLATTLLLEAEDG